MAKKEKQFAVIGLGRFGASVAMTLLKIGYEVLAIDSNPERVQKFSDSITYIVQADTTDENALKELGIRNFDTVVVAIGADIQANTMTTLLLKELGVNRIVAKASNALHGKMLQKIGADRVVYPERDMGYRVAHNLAAPNVLDYIELTPEVSVVEVSAPAILIGKSLAESKLRSVYGINVVAIKRGEQMIVPPLPEEQIRAQDILIVVGDSVGAQRLEELQ